MKLYVEPPTPIDDDQLGEINRRIQSSGVRDEDISQRIIYRRWSKDEKL